MKVCVTRNIPGVAIDLLKEKGYEVSVSLRDHPLNPQELLAFVAEADAIISLLTDKIDAHVMNAAGDFLKIIANYAVGFDNIDLTEAKSRGIEVTNTPSDLICQAVAEHAISLILSLAKRIVEADKYVKAGSYKGWDPNLLIGTELRGKTLGIVGLGRIGSITARLAVSLGMKIMYVSPTRKEEFEKECGGRLGSLEEVLAGSDFVSLHVPLTAETRHLINEKTLARMKKSAFLVNTARGAVVSERDLIEALSNEVIKGAALDVFEDEATVGSKLRSLENVILTPHIASATMEARLEMSRLAADNVVAVLEGKPPLNPAFISD